MVNGSSTENVLIRSVSIVATKQIICSNFITSVRLIHIICTRIFNGCRQELRQFEQLDNFST